MDDKIKNKHKHNKSKYIIFGIIFLTTLVVGLTYAYFSFLGNNTSVTKNYAARTKEGPKVNIYDNTSLLLNLSNISMEETGEDITYYATSSGTPSTSYTEVPLASIDARNLINSQKCTYTLSVTTTGDFYTAYKASSNTTTGEFVLTIGSNTYDFKSTTMPSTVTGVIDEINNTGIKYLNASLLFKNRTSVDQSYLAGKALGISLTVSSMSCEDIPPDVIMNTSYNGTVNSLPTNLLGKSATITGCSGTTWNSKYQRFEISTLTDEYSCDVNYTDPSSTTPLNNYIIGLLGSSNSVTSGNGEVVNEGATTTDAGYRYEGKNPNNYVWFNNELWRIIGVFNGNYHGKSGNLVKIIREDSIGALSFNPEGNTTFEGSLIYNILNGAYINASNTWVDTTNCYGDKSSGITSVCDYTNSGIKSNYLSMVEDAYWLINDILDIESVTKTSAFSTSTKTSIAFKVGLMTASEYGYGASSSCTANLRNYNTNTCAGTNWLYKQGYEWAISPGSDSKVVILSGLGYLGRYTPCYGIAVRPSLYLKSNVYKVSGTGTISDPYILGIS